jgi:hypothetical protein
MSALHKILAISDGEGDHPQGGGGVCLPAEEDPSTVLRTVPLPKQAWGGSQ